MFQLIKGTAFPDQQNNQTGLTSIKSTFRCQRGQAVPIKMAPDQLGWFSWFFWFLRVRVPFCRLIPAPGKTNSLRNHSNHGNFSCDNFFEHKVGFFWCTLFAARTPISPLLGCLELEPLKGVLFLPCISVRIFFGC